MFNRIIVFLASLSFLLLQNNCLTVARVVTINKCCAAGEVIDVNLMKCQPAGEKRWSPNFFKDSANEHGDLGSSEGIERYEITSRIPDCPGTGVHIIPLRDLDEHSIYAAKFRVLESGKIVAKHANGHWVTVPENSCVDGLQNFGNSGNLYTDSARDQTLIACPLLEEEML